MLFSALLHFLIFRHYVCPSVCLSVCLSTKTGTLLFDLWFLLQDLLSQQGIKVAPHLDNLALVIEPSDPDVGIIVRLPAASPRGLAADLHNGPPAILAAVGIDDDAGDGELDGGDEALAKPAKSGRAMGLDGVPRAGEGRRRARDGPDDVVGRD